MHNELDDDFEFPVIFYMKHHRTIIDAFSRKLNIQNCLSQEIRQFNKTALTITFIINKSSYSTPGNILIKLIIFIFIHLIKMHQTMYRI